MGFTKPQDAVLTIHIPTTCIKKIIFRFPPIKGLYSCKIRSTEIFRFEDGRFHQINCRNWQFDNTNPRRRSYCHLNQMTIEILSESISGHILSITHIIDMKYDTIIGISLNHRHEKIFYLQEPYLGSIHSPWYDRTLQGTIDH